MPPADLTTMPERIRTSTTYSGHKALNLVTHGLELTDLSICRDVSAAADDLGANLPAFVITGVITPSNSSEAQHGYAERAFRP